MWDGKGAFCVRRTAARATKHSPEFGSQGTMALVNQFDVVFVLGKEISGWSLNSPVQIIYSNVQLCKPS